MGWYREAGAYSWRRRASVSVDNTAGGAGAIDITFALPVAWDEFWTEIDAAAAELRVADADGSTKLVYSIATFDKTARTGTVSVDGYVAPAAGMLQIFVYWNASGAAAGTAATVIAAAKTGYIEVCGPAGPDLVRALLARPNETRPRKQIAKGSDETRDVWIDLGPQLSGRVVPFAEHMNCDEIDYATYAVNLAGAAQAAMVSATLTRFYAGRYMRVRILGGTTALDYTLVPLVRTVEGPILAPRAWVRVRDLAET